MSAEGREGPTPPDPDLPTWNVDCLDACGQICQVRSATRPAKCGVCGGNNLLATKVSGEPERDEAQPGHRRRGAPKLPPELKKRDKIIVSLTEESAQRYRVIAAQRGYKRVEDWARDALERDASYPYEPPNGVKEDAE